MTQALSETLSIYSCDFKEDWETEGRELHANPFSLLPSLSSSPQKSSEYFTSESELSLPTVSSHVFLHDFETSPVNWHYSV